MTIPFKPPLLGAAYYPELWPEEQQASDIARMKEYGCNVMRVAEFAWAFLEPDEGHYRLDWLHAVIERLHAAEIATVLCTPTATPPVWLPEKHPDVLAVGPDGRPYSHGSRRHTCPTSATYREHSRRITEKMAKEFGNKEGVIAWQLDNELGCHINSCYCDECRAEFHGFLGTLYGDVDNLNSRWGTGVWSQRYQHFEQIPLPVQTPYTHHPSLLYRYRHFMSRQFATFAKEQADLIRQHSPHPITTNAMPSWHKIDYDELYASMDFVSNDLYHGPANLWVTAAEFDWMRAKRGHNHPQRPYWLMETSATWGGSLTPGEPYHQHPGALRAKCWLTWALGGEAVLFWLWRQQWAGQEMEHGALLHAWGQPTLARQELKQVQADLKGAGDFLRRTRVAPAKVAVHFSYPSLWNFDIGSVAPGFDYAREWNEFYRRFLNARIHRDVIFPSADVSDYNIIFSPFLAVIDADLRERMLAFVRSGGTWILGPLAGFRSEDATGWQESAHGPLTESIGADLRHRFPPREGASLTWGKSEKVRCYWWCDAFLGSRSAKVVARYADGPAAGSPAVLENQVGQGRIITLGTLPDPAWLDRWIAHMCGHVSGLPEGIRAPEGVVIVPRVDDSGAAAGFLLVESAGKGGDVKGLPAGRNVLEGNATGTQIRLPSFGVAVIETASEKVVEMPAGE